ncbi:MAG: RecQ family ATP-dependent DNA helicase [Ignavibacteria bacterium]|nr:RecQ family ATP-dependent DNA helicase [Ignavibacteria bacterium]
MLNILERPTIEAAREALKKHFGYPDFRPGQDEIVRSVLEGRNTVAVMPTGGGKSICYQIPAILLDGLTVVVSPLISLMQDQVEALQRARIRATFINSMLDYRDAMERIEKARRGWFTLMYVAPERFESPGFLERMRGVKVALFAVDEAHCISEWGHDFRPSYLKMRDALEFLGTPQVVALTATATPDVREDIRRQLGLKDSNLIVRGFNRENLTFRVLHGVNKRDAVFEACSAGDCGVIYAGTRNTVEELATMLKRHSMSAEAYHAGLEDTHRKEVQERFMRGETRVIVATSAFGMGIDKPDVRFVIHHDMPGTIEQYYQEAGRAGRDGKPSTCTLLYHPGDRSLPEFFIRQTYPDQTLVQTVYGHLHNIAGTQVGQGFRGLLNMSPQTLAGQIGKVSEAAVRSAIDLLERSGYARRIDASYAQSTLHILLDPERLRTWLLETASDTISPVAVAMLRTVGGEAFHHPVDVVIADVAEKSFMSEENILAGLRAMHDDGIIEFHSGQKASGIALLGQRVQVRDLVIDYRQLEKRMKHQFEKLQAMERFILGKACRRNMILEYFEETDIRGTCGKCDTCTSTVFVAPEESAQDIFDEFHALALHCAAELDGKFGRTTLVDVLRGARAKRITQYRLYEASTYNKAPKADRQQLLNVIDALLGLGWLTRSEGVYPSVRITPQGRGKLGYAVAPLALPTEAEIEGAQVNDRVLYEALRAVRRRIAGEMNMPSHTLVTDTVLRAIANAAPEDEDALLGIEGIGPVTLKRIGRQLVFAVREHKRMASMADAMSRAKDAMPTLSSSVKATFDLVTQHMALADIAEKRGMTDGTVSQHIAELIAKGIHVDIDQLVAPEKVAQIRQALGRMQRADLKKVKAMVDSTISFAEIRIVLSIVEREKIVKQQ